jgi:DNA adenine methylase
MTLSTFIKWPGNKSKQLSQILHHIPEKYNTYIEPFIGSGAMFLKLQPTKWIINDINKDLINSWKSIKEHPIEVINGFKEFGKIFIPMKKEEKVLYCRKITAQIHTMPFDTNRAIIYMLMKYSVYMGNILINNKFYFKGLELNVYKNNLFFLKEKKLNNILDTSIFLNKTNGDIYNLDYKKILSKAKENDFVFLDPPYVEKHDYKFNYNKDEIFDRDFLQELYIELQKLDKKGVKWLMTQSSDTFIKKLFNEYNISFYTVYRPYNKKYKTELIIKNF